MGHGGVEREVQPVVEHVGVRIALEQHVAVGVEARRRHDHRLAGAPRRARRHQERVGALAALQRMGPPRQSRGERHDRADEPRGGDPAPHVAVVTTSSVSSGP
jgi:hypothetical protein